MMELKVVIAVILSHGLKTNFFSTNRFQMFLRNVVEERLTTFGIALDVCTSCGDLNEGVINSVAGIRSGGAKPRA